MFSKKKKQWFFLFFFFYFFWAIIKIICFFFFFFFFLFFDPTIFKIFMSTKRSRWHFVAYIVTQNVPHQMVEQNIKGLNFNKVLHIWHLNKKGSSLILILSIKAFNLLILRVFLSKYASIRLRYKILEFMLLLDINIFSVLR